ncbi:hypothetical protein YPPY102_1728, partial [Yersinia pestis PY-102]
MKVILGYGLDLCSFTYRACTIYR